LGDSEVSEQVGNVVDPEETAKEGSTGGSLTVSCVSSDAELPIDAVSTVAIDSKEEIPAGTIDPEVSTKATSSKASKAASADGESLLFLFISRSAVGAELFLPTRRSIAKRHSATNYKKS
jgi:hypothetical protein